MNIKKLKQILQKKKVIYAISIYLIIRIVIPIINFYLRALEKCFSRDYHAIEIHNIFDCIKALWCTKSIWAICFIMVLILTFCILNILFTRKQMKIEKEGISFKNKDGTYGTSNFITPQEIDILKIGDEEKIPGIVIGKTIDTDEIIVLPDSAKSINRNIMIWGASGSRKIYKLYNTKCFEDCRPRNYDKKNRRNGIARKKYSLHRSKTANFLV